jgi:poly-gamma-glutamate capsule biosynthesis protein CapA/YwtB (metallophosphatase superfamily)
MGLREHALDIALEIGAFFRDCDFLVGNLEGVWTNAPRRLPWDQRHDEKIAAALAQLFPPQKTLLSVANNHAADFGPEALATSRAMLRQAGFHVFGVAGLPVHSPTADLHIGAGTLWDNKGGRLTATFDEMVRAAPHLDGMRVAFPHWGFELECYPRRESVEIAAKLLGVVDLIVGHHSHTPQPIAATPAEAGRPTKLIAYSLGDFCFCGPNQRSYAFGEILKVEVGKTAAGRWAVGKVAWQFVESVVMSGQSVRIEMRDACPFFPRLGEGSRLV